MDSSRSLRSASTRWFIAGYAGVVGFLLLEALVRQRGSASDLDTSADDDGTTRQVAAVYVAASLGAPLLRRLPVRPLPALCAPMGLVVLLCGLMLRVWSMQTLSEAYSRTLRVTERQITVDRGPYKHVRHPGYLGSLLIWAGFALTSGSPTVCVWVGGLLVPTYARRMTSEEQLLERQLVGYSEYRARTKKLVPGLW